MITNNVVSWRLASSWFGIKPTEMVYDDYDFPGGSFVRVYLVPDHWIQQDSLPSRFFEIFPPSSGGATGCVKIIIESDGACDYIPCAIYNALVISREWHGFTPGMDPITYMIQDLCGKQDDSERLIIVQSLTNPWLIGCVRSCEPTKTRPCPWSPEDADEIFGITTNLNSKNVD